MDIPTYEDPADVRAGLEEAKERRALPIAEIVTFFHRHATPGKLP